MFKYKIDIIQAMKEKGFSTYKIRKEKLLGEKQLQALRSGQPTHWTTLEKICDILECQPSDILENVKPL